MNYNGIVLSTPQYGFDYPFASGNIVCDNAVTNSVNGVYLSNLTSNTLLYNNTFTDNKYDYNDNSSCNSIVGLGFDYSAEDNGELMLVAAEYASDGRMLDADMEMINNDSRTGTVYQKYILHELYEGSYVKIFAFDKNLIPLHKAVCIE